MKDFAIAAPILDSGCRQKRPATVYSRLAILDFWEVSVKNDPIIRRFWLSMTAILMAGYAGSACRVDQMNAPKPGRIQPFSMPRLSSTVAYTLGLSSANNTLDSIRLPDLLAGKFVSITVSGLLTQKLRIDTTSPVPFGPNGWREDNVGCTFSVVTIFSGGTPRTLCNGPQSQLTIAIKARMDTGTWVKRSAGKADCNIPAPCREYTGSQNITVQVVNPNLLAYANPNPVNSGSAAHFYVRWDVQPDDSMHYETQVDWIGWYWQSVSGTDTTYASMCGNGSTDCVYSPTQSGHAVYRYSQDGSSTRQVGIDITVTGTRCSTPGDALLQNSNVLAGVQTLWEDSSFIYNVIPNRREAVGIAYISGVDTLFAALQNVLSGTAAVCRFRVGLPRVTIIGVFHTHPFQLAEFIPPPICDVPGDYYRTDPMPSPYDAVLISSYSFPSYVMDGGNIYRLVPGFGTHNVGNPSPPPDSLPIPNPVWTSATYLTTYQRGPSCHYP